MAVVFGVRHDSGIMGDSTYSGKNFPSDEYGKGTFREYSAHSFHVFSFIMSPAHP